MLKCFKVLGFLSFFALVACDDDGGVSAPQTSTVTNAAKNAIYFPDGGGIEFAKPYVENVKGPGWEYKDLILDENWPELSVAIKEVMMQQGYEDKGEIELLGFEKALSFGKKGSVKRVNYRAKHVKTVMGERVMLRLSWHP